MPRGRPHKDKLFGAGADAVEGSTRQRRQIGPPGLAAAGLVNLRPCLWDVVGVRPSHHCGLSDSGRTSSGTLIILSNEVFFVAVRHHPRNGQNGETTPTDLRHPHTPRPHIHSTTPTTPTACLYESILEEPLNWRPECSHGLGSDLGAGFAPCPGTFTVASSKRFDGIGG